MLNGSTQARRVGIIFVSVLALGVASALQHLDSHEAAGKFWHVAGSACCHPQAVPWSRTPAPKVCEQRCEDSTACDAYIFAPSDGSCWLVRFERDSDGVPMVATRPASDRVFGLVADFNSAGSFKNPGGKSTGSKKHEPGTRSSKPAGRARPKEQEEEEEECESFWFEGDVQCDEKSSESECGSEYFDWSSAAFEEEFCFVGGEECESEFCAGRNVKQWARKFKQARKQIWPTREACFAECTDECAVDMKEARAEALEFAKNLIEKLFGKDADVEFMSGEEDEDTEELVFCRDVCGDVCEDFDRPSWAPGPDPNTETRCEACSSPACGKTTPRNQDEDIAKRVADRLRVVLDRASLKIREAAPDFMASALPALSGLHGGLLGNDPAAQLPFRDSEDELFGDLEGSALLGSSVLGPTDFLAALLGDEAWMEAPDAEIDDLSAYAPLNSALPRDASDLPLANRVASVELVPSRASLHQGLPQAARWAAGSPPFLERLLQRASARLGLGPMASVIR